MIVSKIIKITQSRELSRKIVKCSRETDIVYDMTIMIKLAHPGITQFDINNLTTGWRREFGLTCSVRMHEAASKHAFQAAVKFRKANRLKHNKRIWRKRQIKMGKKKTYRHNGWTEPSGLMRRGRKTTRLRSLNSRGKPKLRDSGAVFLPGLGEVRPRTKVPEGKPVSFQMIDITGKVTRKTRDGDREFKLHLQIEVPDTEPATGGCKAGLDLGVRHLAAVADEHGNERLYDVPGGCKRHDGDRIDQLKSLRSRCQAGSRRWKEIGRRIAHELKKTSNRQKHNEADIARRITKGLSVLFLEDLDLTRMRRSNGAASKTGLNREMAYSRMGEFRSQVEWQMKKKGGITRRVESAHTSQRCAACQIVDKKSRNGESFVCTSCGWCHHADKNAAKNILDNDCLHTEETGGQAHGNRGGTIAGVEVVTRREDHGSDGSGMNDSTGRLGPDYDNIGRSDRAPERASGHATERSVCTNFCSPLYNTIKDRDAHHIRRNRHMVHSIFSLTIEEVRKLVERNEVSVCVVGIGRIGLPTALMFARSGFKTVGVDIDEDLVARLSSGDFSLKDEPGLEDIFRQVVDDGLFRATTSLEDGVSCSDIIVLSLPTPVTGDNIPDYSALETVGRRLGDLTRTGSIIVVESTIEPGFLENEFLGLVEGGKAGVKAGVNVGVGVCPEAANPGEILRDFARLPRMVGATDGETVKKIAEVYRHAFPVDFRMMPDCKTANAAKLVANVFRDVNIAFVNELALLFDRLGIDTKTVLEAADSKYNFQIHYPGAGAGGPCLPANSYQLLNSAKTAGCRLSRIIEAGRQVNEQMPIYVVELLKDALRQAGKEIESSVVLVLGVSYKPDIRDMQTSPAESVILRARKAGAKIKIYDPYFKEVTAYGIHTESNLDDAISGTDAAVIVTAHAEFRDMGLEHFAKMRTPVLVDARGIVDARLAEEAGLVFRGLGRGRVTNN